MHTLRRFFRSDGSERYGVGYYDPDATRERWIFVGDFDEINDAAAWVSYLNGGAKPTGPLPRIAKPEANK